MTESASEVKKDILDIVGLDEVFEAEFEPIESSASRVTATASQGAQQGIWQGAGMSLKAACLHYRLAPSTLRAKIKRGEIPATKIDGSNGPEWRIFANGRGISSHNEHGRTQGAKQSENTPLNDTQHEQAQYVNRLLALVDKQSLKLEVASGQIGYLSAQLESYQKQGLMLPDLETEAKRAQQQDKELELIKSELDSLKGSWWYRLSRFLSVPK